MTETPVHGAFWKKGGMDMSSGQFWWGMTTGLVAGAVVGMSVAPSRREMKKTAHKVAKHVNEAVEDGSLALGM